MRFLSVFVLLLALSLTQCQKSTPEAKNPDTQPQAAQNGAGEEAEPQEEPPLPPDQILPPMEAIKDLDRKIERYKTGASLTEKDLEENRNLKTQILKGTFDIRELSRLALAEHWETLSTKDRNYFTNLMTNLLEKKAIFSKEQVKGEGKPYQITYKGEKFVDDQKTKSLVTTSLRVPSQKITLAINYQLLSTPRGWKIYDVIVDDASLVENYKFQFDTIIKKYGYQELINRMQNKLKQME